MIEQTRLFEHWLPNTALKEIDLTGLWVNGKTLYTIEILEEEYKVINLSTKKELGIGSKLILKAVMAKGNMKYITLEIGRDYTSLGEVDEGVYSRDVRYKEWSWM